MSFLAADYQAPPSGGSAEYMKFKEGLNHFRITSNCETGWEYWNKEGKPVRSRIGWDKTPADIRIDEQGKPERPRHIWIVTAYDYNDGLHKILQISQSTVREALMGYAGDGKWGHPCQYDIKVTRDKNKPASMMYAVTVNPKESLTVDALVAVYSTPYNLEALFAGESPAMDADANPVLNEAGRTLLNQYRKGKGINDDKFKSDMADVQGGKADKEKLNCEQAIALVSLYANAAPVPESIPF